MSPTSLKSLTKHPARFFLAAFALALAVAAIERGAAAVVARSSEPGRGASWIWSAEAEKAAEVGEPVAFFAVRDFEIDRVESARLAIAADEEYVARVNGRRVGTGRYRAEEAIDLYDVTEALEPGWNRLAIEVRSSRGAGGLLASLRLGEDDRVALVTDATWRIFQRAVPGIVHGWALEAGDEDGNGDGAGSGEEPMVWRRYPTGRWRLEPPAAALPSPKEWTASLAANDLPALAVRLPWGDHRWLPRAEVPHFSELGRQLLFDWGTPVTGRLRLGLATHDGSPGLVFVGLEPPDERLPPADAIVVPISGASEWIDAEIRRFRYVWVEGLELDAAPVVEPTPSERATPSPRVREGVYGVRPPRADSLAEEKIRDRLRDAADAETP